MEKLFKIFDRLWKLVEIAGCLMIIVVAIVALFQILARYLSSTPISWTEEFIRYSIAWITYIGAPICLRRGKMLGIEFVRNQLPEKIRYIVAYIADIVMLTLFIFITYLGFEVMMGSFNAMTMTLGISMGVIYLIVPVSTVLMALVIVEMIMKDIYDKRKVKVC